MENQVDKDMRSASDLQFLHDPLYLRMLMMRPMREVQASSFDIHKIRNSVLYHFIYIIRRDGHRTDAIVAPSFTCHQIEKICMHSGWYGSAYDRFYQTRDERNMHEFMYRGIPIMENTCLGDRILSVCFPDGDDEPVLYAMEFYDRRLA